MIEFTSYRTEDKATSSPWDGALTLQRLAFSRNARRPLVRRATATKRQPAGTGLRWPGDCVAVNRPNPWLERPENKVHLK